VNSQLEKQKLKVVVIGGGAAGFFAALTCAEQAKGNATVVILEKGPEFLSKVRISGGGRCNVTHACFNPKQLSTHYPRGERALIGPFSRFQPEDTISWFQARGVKLKTETDGRMFPVTNSSQTIIDCFLDEAEKLGVELRAHCGVEEARRGEGGGFELRLSTGETMRCDHLILATGGCRSMAGAGLAHSLGHTIEEPVPSLFTFQIEQPWLNQLAGISVDPVKATIPGTKLSQTGPILVTHSGLSGPAILKLSAWGARQLSELHYQFPMRINWLSERSTETAAAELRSRGESQPAGLVVNAPIRPVPARLWEQLVLASGIPRQTRWGAFPKAQLVELAKNLTACEFHVSGKSTNKAEFVTCGGVRLSEVNFKTMESKLVPGLYFGGELLDIDGITGGFNFQAAWTTGWIAGMNCCAT
jgi:predicted Rossmann fold flavoprotein